MMTANDQTAEPAGVDVGLGTPDGPPMDKPIETPAGHPPDVVTGLRNACTIAMECFGDVGDSSTQEAVLRAGLAIFEQAVEPGHVEQLPFVWHEDPKETKWHPSEPSPIIALMKKRRSG